MIKKAMTIYFHGLPLTLPQALRLKAAICTGRVDAELFRRELEWEGRSGGSLTIGWPHTEAFWVTESDGASPEARNARGPNPKAAAVDSRTAHPTPALQKNRLAK